MTFFFANLRDRDFLVQRISDFLQRTPSKKPCGSDREWKWNLGDPGCEVLRNRWEEHFCAFQADTGIVLEGRYKGKARTVATSSLPPLSPVWQICYVWLTLQQQKYIMFFIKVSICIFQEVPELPSSSPLAVSPPSALNNRPVNFCAGEVPTASQGLLKLFRRNSEELLGPKGVNDILT